MQGYDQKILIFGDVCDPVFKIELLDLFQRFLVDDRDVSDDNAVSHIRNAAATASERYNKIVADVNDSGGVRAFLADVIHCGISRVIGGNVRSVQKPWSAAVADIVFAEDRSAH